MLCDIFTNIQTTIICYVKCVGSCGQQSAAFQFGMLIFLCGSFFSNFLQFWWKFCIVC